MIDNKALPTKEEIAKMSVAQIARLIQRDWKKVYFGAVPYLDAMCSLHTDGEAFYNDSFSSILRYFLGNAAAWRGDLAKIVKADLKARAAKAGY